MWARVQAASPDGTGFADPVIYKVAENSTDYARDFNDYQVGTNGAYQAAPGWDYVTGWGTPVLRPFIQDFDGGGPGNAACSIASCRPGSAVQRTLNPVSPSGGSSLTST
ncbi:MAG: hypothetical protein ACXVH3_07965 [Solirubrobacteraceae bacterium]